MDEGDRAALKNLDVLIVDDDPDSQEALRALLQQHGARATCASSAAEAAEFAVAGLIFRVLVSDLEMPGLDGFWLIGRLRNIATRAARPFWAILLTGSARDEIESKAREAGFDVVLRKPLDLERLLKAVASHRAQSSP